MIEWQPIETAPKDGTPIFVHLGDGYHWVTWRKAASCWKTSAFGEPLHPTHWLPLKPPATGTTDPAEEGSKQ